MTEGQLGAPVHGATHPSRSSRPRWLSVTCGLAVAACSAALLAYAELGRFSRYVADDFCTAGILRDYSFLGAQRYWYLNWSGRYSFTLAITALERLFGLPIVPLLPALVLALWLGVAFLAIR